MFGRAGTELGLIHQVETGWTTLHTVDVVLEYRNLKYNKIIIKKLVFYSYQTLPIVMVGILVRQ